MRLLGPCDRCPWEAWIQAEDEGSSGWRKRDWPCDFGGAGCGGQGRPGLKSTVCSPPFHIRCVHLISPNTGLSTLHLLLGRAKRPRLR